MKELTTELLKEKIEWGKLIKKENGEIGNFNISSTLTFLIQQTGRFVERYASDLFIDWKTVEECINEGRESWFVFGLRESGVDGINFVVSRFNNGDFYEYRKIYGLIIEVNNDNITTKLMEI